MVEHVTENHGVVSPILTLGINNQIMFQNIDLKKFLDTKYIFEKTPPPISDYLYLAIVFAVFVVLGIFFWIWYNRKTEFAFWKEFRYRLFNLFFYIGLVGLVLVFSRWQGIPYVGSRFFILVDFLIFIIWGMWIIYFRLIIIPKEIKKFERKQQFEKYLPTAGRSSA